MDNRLKLGRTHARRPSLELPFSGGGRMKKGRMEIKSVEGAQRRSVMGLPVKDG
uniref:Uncharacterized protein n=1 Tax=Arion vulgaris TaxID=1028688 RepID=A0A0B7BQY2_9EUPU